MLEELHVRDLALIEDASLEFSDRFTVLTGETGAGKTALLSAVKLLVGERADSTMVRAGATEAVVEGRIRQGSTELVVQRRLAADGRARCKLDGEMAAVRELASTVGPLFDLHGQHDHQALLHSSRHVEYVDRYIGEQAKVARETYSSAFRDHVEAVSEFEALDARLTEDRRRSDYLRFIAEEIEAVDPKPDEDAVLEARLPGLRHGERLTAASSEAYGLLREESGAGDAMAAAVRALAHVNGVDPTLDALSERLSEAVVVVEDIGASLREYGESIEHDPAALNTVEARLAALGELKKKYGPALCDVMATLEDARRRLGAVDNGEHERQVAQQRLAKVAADLHTAGERLAKIRHAAAGGFVTALEQQTSDLAMDGASFDVRFSELEFDAWTIGGPHRAEFLYAAGPDQPLRSLSKIASGGEVSRVMLALKTVLGAADDVPILVFDEIDAGIGGTTAHAVGAKLAQLARTHQVLVVTHLAQVAAFADHHLVVVKSVEDGGVHTDVMTVVGDERVAEIARMLSGGDTEAGRAHAEELLRDVSADSERVKV